MAFPSSILPQLLRRTFPRPPTGCRIALFRPQQPHYRLFSASFPLFKKQLPPRPKIDEKDVEVSYIKGSGPGGQKINKTNSAVQLKHKPTGIVVKSQATRSRSQNKKIAMELLAEKVDELEKGDQSRAAIKREIERKRKASRAKKARRKYRALEEKKKKALEEEQQQEYEEEAETQGEVEEVEGDNRQEGSRELKASN
ncbi:hypothetical protein VTN49DRAFT_2474 [Thermomyces lanuginosus]|uniref:uncharacterized protein n=1 Tax=Thermomyces lanuginosus TaxID=5541 RepID=UPI0037420B3C